MAAIEDEQAADENDDSDFLEDSAEQLAAKRACFAQLRRGAEITESFCA
jgi:hypothetical protein